MNVSTTVPEMPCPADEPGAELLALINGGWSVQVIRTACVLQLPDHLARGPRTAEALAADTGCDATSLDRLLHAMAALGLCETGAARQHRLTATGELLRRDVPGSLCHWALHAGGGLWQRLGDLPEAVRTGASWTQRHHGVDGYDRLAAEADAQRVFHRAMVELTQQAVPHLVLALQLGSSRWVVDVGGGQGALLGAALASAPGAHGVLLDRPAALAGAVEVLERAGVADRCRIEAGDFFEAVPGGGDAYLLKSVLHNWDDPRCRQILRQCRRAMRPTARLLVIERVRPDEPGSGTRHRAVARTDMNMLVSLTGRERTEREYAALFADTGLQPPTLRETAAEWSVLETRPA